VRKNLLLTLWLLFPIMTMGVLVWVIFATVGAPKKMDVPARGPGAGDTGGANALGEWLAGNDPNEVDPAKWPGGVELRVPTAAFRTTPTLAPEGEEDAHTWVPILRDGSYVWVLKPYDVRVSDAFILSAGGEARRVTLPPTNPGGAARNEPIIVELDG